MPVVPQDGEAILKKRSSAHIATIGPNGEPQSSPVWVDWDGQYVKISLTTTRQKYRNMQREPRAALSAHDPDRMHNYIEVRGTAVRIEYDRDNTFYNQLAKKYLRACS